MAPSNINLTIHISSAEAFKTMQKKVKDAIEADKVFSIATANMSNHISPFPFSSIKSEEIETVSENIGNIMVDQVKKKIPKARFMDLGSKEL